ncbi:carboxymuconolactone decarboxylase family protein [Limimaricola cinnabarinus]|uniref:carboxymuconolactone decarboxylase family protein n=1 Tax=Limimaricola cinnabarinus TaxID=1125964 RepID=UPI00248FC243|nr:carboxymuconolactone decarboxylase family protein [Limimaricola cinnabarinus]
MPINRHPDLDEQNLTSRQREVFTQIVGGKRGLVQGPLRVWLQSPELADRAQALGAFCRYDTVLPPRLSELAILVTGAFWKSGFEWAVHAPIASSAGLSNDVIEAIRLGREPEFKKEDELAIYDFANQLHRQHIVDEAVHSRVVSMFGTQAAVELVGLLGYYTLISMTINAFEVPLPAEETDPFFES